MEEQDETPTAPTHTPQLGDELRIIPFMDDDEVGTVDHFGNIGVVGVTC